MFSVEYTILIVNTVIVSQTIDVVVLLVSGEKNVCEN